MVFCQGCSKIKLMPRILFIGDIVGRPGRDIIAERLPRLRMETGADVVIANGENAAAGNGLTAALAKTLLASGIQAITLGDHVWDQRGWESDIGKFPAVCRPANLPKSNPGNDHVIIDIDGFRLGIFTLLGRQFVNLKAECPFLAADAMIEKLRPLTDGILVEMHAEATSEKIAMGWYLDGRVLAVLGTHTHVPTADAGILPQGTAFICDVGMTGPYYSVLGRKIEAVVGRFVDGLPRRFEVAQEDVRISAVLVDYDTEAKRSRSITLTGCRRIPNLPQ